MLRAIIAEDDPLTSHLLRKTLEKIDGLEVVKQVKNGKDLIKAVECANPDVLFIDIYMPQMSGLEAAKEIYNIDPDIFIVFITAHSHYALEAFNLYAFDYIVKPFRHERLKETISRIEKVYVKNVSVKENVIPLPEAGNSKLYVKSLGNAYFVNIPDIIMVTRIQRKIAIYTTKDTIITYEGLESIEKKLSGDFFRCHKGYIVNLNMIQEISPCGTKTCMIKLLGIKETALATTEKVKLVKEILRKKSTG